MSRTLNDDWMPWNADEYRAVVNPTEMAIEAYGHGRRLMMLPSEVHDPKRSCIQFVKTRIARKAVKRMRQLLEIWTVSAGRELLLLSQEIGFQAAYRKITGKSPRKAGAMIAMQNERDSLFGRLLREHGVPAEHMSNWTVGDMRAVLKEPELAVDLDESGRPRRSLPKEDTRSPLEKIAKPDEGMRAFFAEDNVGGVRSGEHGLTESEGDFLNFDQPDPDFVERVGEGEKDLVEMASEAALKYDVEHDNKVVGKAPKTAEGGMQVRSDAAPVETADDVEKSLARPPREPSGAPRRGEGPDQEVVALRKQVEQLGGKWHPRSQADKLRSQIEELISEAV